MKNNQDTVQDIVLDGNQCEAVEKAASSRFFIINGGAGTGKTTIISRLCGMLQNAVLCSFTGKAAARIREATGILSQTIHRLLKWNGTKFMAGNLSDCNIVIDEASMLSSTLLAEIVRRCPRSLTLVGDEAQLPPVGEGQPFHDLVRAMPERVHTLTTCYRATGAICQAGQAIRNGFMPKNMDSDGELFETKQTGDAEKTHQAILDIVRMGSIDFKEDVVLVPRNEGPFSSVGSLNRAIRDIVNPGEDIPFRPEDRVMNLKNNSHLDIWNGTTGKVVSVMPSGRMIIETDLPVMDDEGKPKSEVVISPEEARNFTLAYAMTVHKAQGSQYRGVWMACLSRDSYTLLDNAMMYTAVTRARKSCHLIGEIRAIHAAIGNRTSKRTVMQLLAEKDGYNG